MLEKSIPINKYFLLDIILYIYIPGIYYIMLYTRSRGVCFQCKCRHRRRGGSPLLCCHQLVVPPLGYEDRDRFGRDFSDFVCILYSSRRVCGGKIGETVAYICKVLLSMFVYVRNRIKCLGCHANTQSKSTSIR